MPDQAPVTTPRPRPDVTDSPGWRVEPAPDGRGKQAAKPPMFPRSRALLAFFVGLLVLNLLISFLTGAPPDRPRVPYQPFFLQQVEAGNVETITSREDSIEGELRKPTTYDPPGDDKPVEVERFKTQVPAFIDRTGLTTLLTDKEVVINARAPDAGRSFFLSLVLGLAPALILVGFFVWLSRRGAGGGFGSRSTSGWSRSTRSISANSNCMYSQSQ